MKKTIADIFEIIAMLAVLPFVLAFRLIVFLAITSFIWTIPVAILIWVIKR